MALIPLKDGALAAIRPSSEKLSSISALAIMTKFLFFKKLRHW
jgi:hypothetical protein